MPTPDAPKFDPNVYDERTHAVTYDPNDLGAYREALRKVEDEFRLALEAVYNADDYPEEFRDLVYSKAWDRGHASGLTEVASVYGTLFELAEACFLLGRRSDRR